MRSSIAPDDTPGSHEVQGAERFRGRLGLPRSVPAALAGPFVSSPSLPKL
jgi:hypothetical protein